MSQKIYDRSPIFVQNMLVSLKGRLNDKQRYGKEYYRYREFLREFDTWPLEKKLEYQREELVRFVRFAYDHSPFYHELYKDVDMDSIRTVADLQKLPWVDKEMLRANIEACTVKGIGPCSEAHTGGTTGKSLSILRTEQDLMQRMAMLDHFKARLGYEHLKMTRATFNGKHIVPAGQKKKCFCADLTAWKAH
jgi:phenylacetate-CoA ligase